MPRLGGPKPKLDPRYAKKRRPVKKGAKPGEKEDQERGDLEERQNENGRDLEAAEKSLESDQNSLEAMIRQLQQAANGKPSQGKPQGENELDSVANQLREMMQSASLRAAMQMAAAARAMQQGQQRGQPQTGPAQPRTAQADEGNLDGTMPAAGEPDGKLAKLDPATRAMIMKMPPSRFRDELIQGLNEQGPEAYRAFIEDYFKRLTETKAPGK
jgi:hypothetical protein